MPMHKVFVYGTLKTGFPNFTFNQGQQFRQEFVTKERYPLYLVGKRYVPWLINTPQHGYQIKGQVFQVSESALSLMDDLEDINKSDGYQRITLDVICASSKEKFSVFAYLKPKERLIGQQIMLELSNEYTQEHARQYTPKR